MNMRIRIATLLALTAAIAVEAAYETVTYSYDGAGRLTNALYSGGADITYTYDDAGNLLTRTVTTPGGGTYTLVYTAGQGGYILGVATQVVSAGAAGTPVEAVGDDATVAFHDWSDARTDNPRTDSNITADITVHAGFRSEGGADPAWYAAHGFEPDAGETWSDLDSHVIRNKHTTLRQEYFADTDPNDTGDVFRVLNIHPGPPPVIMFRPGSTGRIYTLQYNPDLNQSESWTNVPGFSPQYGSGGTDEVQDLSSPADDAVQYRIQVGIP